MTGICGLVLGSGRAPEFDVAGLERMARAVADSAEAAVETFIEGPVGLAAVVSPGYISGIRQREAGGAPVALAFTGTLYAGVPEAGDPLEGLLAAYLDKGAGFLAELDGEYSLAIWDGRSGELLLADDPFRVHSLLYHAAGERAIFASRMAGMLASPTRFQPSVDPRSVIQFVGSSFIPTPHTIFTEVQKLPAGSSLRFKPGSEPRIESHWDIDYRNPFRDSTASLQERCRELFRGALESRVRADGQGRRGAFLSGGVDSSTVLGVLSQIEGGGVDAFSIGFGEDRFNEIHYARVAAKAFGARHHEYFVTPEDTREAIPLLLRAFDEPFGNASAVPTYFCAKLAKDQGVDTLYAGDGGDELFAGNERYAKQKLFDYYYRIPKIPREYLLRPAVFGLAGLGIGPIVRGKKYIQRASIPYPDRLTSYTLYRILPREQLFENAFAARVSEEEGDTASFFAYHYHRAQADDELDRQLYIDLKLAIADNDLFKVTRMTEAAGVRVRFPFLDRNLAEFSARVPPSTKMAGRRLRSFFKDSYREMLPHEVLNKEKHGFGLPIPVWLKSDPGLHEMMRELVLGKRTEERGYFRMDALKDLVQRHQEDSTSFYGTVLWKLMVMELWLREHQDGAAARLVQDGAA